MATRAPPKPTPLPDAERASLADAGRLTYDRGGEETVTDSLGRVWLFRVDRAPMITLYVKVTARQSAPKTDFTQDIRIPASCFGATPQPGDPMSLAVDALDDAAADAMG